MTWAAADFLVIAFLMILSTLRVVPRAGEVLLRSRAAVAELRSTTLTDEEKERAMRVHSGRLLGLFLVLSGSVLVAVAVPAGVVALLDLAGVLSLDQVLDRLASWQLLVAGTVLGVAVVALPRRAP